MPSPLRYINLYSKHYIISVSGKKETARTNNKRFGEG